MHLGIPVKLWMFVILTAAPYPGEPCATTRCMSDVTFGIDFTRIHSSPIHLRLTRHFTRHHHGCQWWRLATAAWQPARWNCHPLPGSTRRSCWCDPSPRWLPWWKSHRKCPRKMDQLDDNFVIKSMWIIILKKPGLGYDQLFKNKTPGFL